MARHSFKSGGTHKKHTLIVRDNYKLHALPKFERGANVGRDNDLALLTDSGNANKWLSAGGELLFVQCSHVGNILL